MKQPSTDEKIRISWAITNAVRMVARKNIDLSGMSQKNQIKGWTYYFLSLFDEIIKELPEEVCAICGGTASEKDPLILRNGDKAHNHCYQDQLFKAKDNGVSLKADK